MSTPTTIRRSPPNSSYSSERIEPCHVPVTASAPWYWTLPDYTKLILIWGDMINYIAIVKMRTKKSFIHLRF